MKDCGINEQLLKWLENYLSNRKFSVKIDGISSDIFTVNAGVPQGSVLAPTLFLVYINDLLNLPANPIFSYADDSTLLASYVPSKKGDKNIIARNRSVIASSINQDLQQILDWGGQNLVSFNASKTQLCNFSRLKCCNPEIISFNSINLQSCNSIRVLGITINKDLRWNDHIRIIAKGASCKMGFLYRCKQFFTSHQLSLIYKSFIRPCIEYCSHVWGGASNTALGKLDRVQKRAIRLIGDPAITDAFDSLHHRRVVADLTVFYKIFHGQCRDEIKNIIAPKEFSRDTRLARAVHDHVVVIDNNIKHNTNLFRDDFFHRTSRVWNNLPQSVFPPAMNVQTFKKNANLHLKSLSPTCLNNIYVPFFKL